MEINNTEIVTYTYTKKLSDEDVAKTSDTDTSNLENTKLLDGEIYDTVELSGGTEVVTYATTSPPATSETDKIKQILYRLNHATDVNTIKDINDGSKTYNMDNAYDLLKYANSKISTIDINEGITRAQLYQFTQDDDMEDNNSNFFGKLFSAFDEIDTAKDSDNDASNDILTYDELNAYLGNIKSDGALSTKIEAYSNELQTEFETAASKGDTTLLNWVIDKATDYMQAAGLTKQLESLTRLQNANLISLADCNSGKTYTGLGSWTLGCYSSTILTSSHQWISDTSLQLDKQYYNPNINSNLTWYNMVGTLVHELTHATTAYYSGITGSVIKGEFYYSGGTNAYSLSDYAFKQLKSLYDNNLLSTKDKTLYNNYINASGTGYVEGITDAQKQSIVDIINTFSLECSAFQVDEDYADSIGKGDNTGANEKQKTIDHIETYYIDNGSTYQPGTGVGKNYDGDWWVTYKGSGFSYNA